MPGPNGKLIEDISAVRIGLERFAAEQTDPAVRFFLACLEYRLTSAAERYADPEFRSWLAADVDRLAAAVRVVRRSGRPEIARDRKTLSRAGIQSVAG
jgi:hypothetical protein